MFDSIGWGEILVIVLAGLFILGPERLPGAAAWLGRNVRQFKDFAAGATTQIREELGPEFDELRAPLAQLNRVRRADPRKMAMGALFDSLGPADPADPTTTTATTTTPPADRRPGS
jgi:sec-independent protein translocase protein TatB